MALTAFILPGEIDLHEACRWCKVCDERKGKRGEKRISYPLFFIENTYLTTSLAERSLDSVELLR